MVLIKTKDGESRLHSSRRIAKELAQIGANMPVIHHMYMPAGDRSAWSFSRAPKWVACSSMASGTVS